MNISNLISIISLIFSVFAFYYSRKYKEIESKLNKLEIEKIKEEKIEKKKANIVAEFVKINKPNSSISNKLQIKNIGNIAAKNIRIELLEKKQGIDILEKSKLPLDKLYPKQSVNLIASISFSVSGSTPKIKIKFIWDDDFQKNREEIQEVLI